VTTSATAAKSTATPGASPAAETDGCQVKLTGKTGLEFGKEKVEYTLTNATTKTVVLCELSIYAYDKADKQISKNQSSLDFLAFEAGASKKELAYIEDPKSEKSLAGAPDVSFELVVTQVKYADGTGWKDLTLAPAARPKGGKR
jgi:hypothetical protein